MQVYVCCVCNNVNNNHIRLWIRVKLETMWGRQRLQSGHAYYSRMRTLADVCLNYCLSKRKTTNGANEHIYHSMTMPMTTPDSIDWKSPSRNSEWNTRASKKTTHQNVGSDRWLRVHVPLAVEYWMLHLTTITELTINIWPSSRAFWSPWNAPVQCVLHTHNSAFGRMCAIACTQKKRSTDNFLRTGLGCIVAYHSHTRHHK